MIIISSRTVDLLKNFHADLVRRKYYSQAKTRADKVCDISVNRSSRTTYEFSRCSSQVARSKSKGKGLSIQNGEEIEW